MKALEQSPLIASNLDEAISIFQALRTQFGNLLAANISYGNPDYSSSPEISAIKICLVEHPQEPNQLLVIFD